MAKVVPDPAKANFNETEDNGVSSQFEEFGVSHRNEDIVSKSLALDGTILANKRSDIHDSSDEYIENL